jgi:hypothetical protein
VRFLALHFFALRTESDAFSRRLSECPSTRVTLSLPTDGSRLSTTFAVSSQLFFVHFPDRCTYSSPHADDTKSLASIHTHFAQTIESTVIRQLESVRADIKAQITTIEKEASAIADEVDKEVRLLAPFYRTLETTTDFPALFQREHSKRELLELQSGIDTFENSSTQMLPQKDPYLAHHIVENQMKKQVHKENDLQSALIRFQQQQPAFEEGVSRKIQSSIKLYEDARLSTLEEIEGLHKRIASSLQRTTPEFEWQFYLNTTDNKLVDPSTPLRSAEAINFPGLGHASTKAIKEGYLERKKRFSKSYKESYYVLTPSGYLHERKSRCVVVVVLHGVVFSPSR